MADLRLAVMGRQLFRRESILAIGPRVVRVAVGFVERIDHERPLYFNRLFLLALEEHQSPAESADRRLARLGQYCVGPQGDDSVGLARLLVFLERPVRPSITMRRRR